MCVFLFFVCFFFFFFSGSKILVNVCEGEAKNIKYLIWFFFWLVLKKKKKKAYLLICHEFKEVFSFFLIYVTTI